MKLTSQTKNYANLLKEIKTRITQAQYEALKTVNKARCLGYIGTLEK